MTTLLDSRGFFYHDPHLYKHAADSQVEEEIRSQCDWIIQQGAHIDHVDSHCGTVYGLAGRPFLDPVFRLCAEKKLPFRLPKSPRYLQDMFGEKVPDEATRLHRQVVETAAELGIPLLDDMFTSHHAYKDLSGYSELKEFYLRRIQEIGEGITELFLHPSYLNEEIAAIFPDWHKRIWEMEFLLDDALLKVIEEEDIQLVSWSTAPW